MTLTAKFIDHDSPLKFQSFEAELPHPVYTHALSRVSCVLKEFTLFTTKVTSFKIHCNCSNCIYKWNDKSPHIIYKFILITSLVFELFDQPNVLRLDSNCSIYQLCCALWSGIDFTNMFIQSFYASRSFKCKKRQSSHQCLFVLLGPAHLKAARIML